MAGASTLLQCARGLAGAAALTACLAAPTSAAADTAAFEYNGTTGEDGTAQQWIVPEGVTSATFELFGAQGANGARLFPSLTQGGLGGRASATIPVTAGQVFLVYVGGRPTSFQGGFNGGGGLPSFGGVSEVAGSGGGATDIRTGPTLGDRVLVAAGGGGGGGSGLSAAGVGQGGAGGMSNAVGTDGQDLNGNAGGGDGGTAPGPAAGGEGGLGGAGLDAGRTGATGGSGALGLGGSGGAGGSGGLGSDGGGGGGGIYGGGGGGGGGFDQPAGEPGGGGGGAGGSSGVPAASPIAAPSPTLEEGVRAGNGRAVITYSLAQPPSPPAGPSPPAPSPPAAPKARVVRSPKARGRGDGTSNPAKKRYVFKFNDDLPGVTFRCKLDAGAYEPCTSPTAYRGLERGRHTFKVKSVSAAGVESSTRTVDFSVPLKTKKRSGGNN